MAVSVLIGYKDEEGEYHGFLGSLETAEYRLLKRLSEKCVSPGILSIDELKALSDVKDLLAKAWIKLYEVKKELPQAAKQKMENVGKGLGETLKSFDVYRENTPQLDFLMSFCVMDANYCEPDEKSGEYESKNFQYVDPDTPGVSYSVELGAVKQIAVSEDIVSAISEWIDLDGRRLLCEASMAEDDNGAMETEIEWWRDNISYFEEELEESDLTMMLFRALRNNEQKCKRNNMYPPRTGAITLPT